jgi:hypothetical protein
MNGSNAISASSDAPGTGSHKARSILFACDGKSDVSMQFAVAANIAKTEDALLRCICIVEQPPIAADLIMQSTFREDCAACAGRLSAFDVAAADAGIGIEVETLFGSPREQIAAQVRMHRIGLLILPALHNGMVFRLQRQLVLRDVPGTTVIIVDESGQFSFAA